MHVNREVNMFKDYRKHLVGIVLPILFLAFAGIGVASMGTNPDPSGSAKQTVSLTDQVRHELLMLPYYGVFDQLSFSIEGNDTVVLSGQVTRPVLKSDAEAVVRKVKGAAKVVNNIEVLPLSRMDDSIRLAAYRAIFSRPGFAKYAIQANSPIRIIVKNGNITLDGFVISQTDKTIAEMAARGVPFTFSVTNNLAID
jgi:hyperosmotically inducible periplasmic protein